jgi:pimeloyl-ACP methyl ester carboxylesterase
VVSGKPTGPSNSAADRIAARLIEGVPVTARRLDIAGVSTALLEGGAGRPVVLLHGHGGFAESFAGVICALVDRHRVIAPDLPGLGRSELRGGQLGPSGSVRWLAQLIDATCPAPPTLVGFSAGTGIAVRYVTTAPHPPRLLLVSPTSLAQPRRSLSLRRSLACFTRSPSRAAADRIARHVLGDADRVHTTLGSRFTTIQDYVIDRARQPGHRAANRAVSMPIGADELRRITAPVAMISGRDDPIVPIEHLRRISADLGWPLAVIDDAGHVPHLEQPATFCAALRTAIDIDRPQHQQEHR